MLRAIRVESAGDGFFVIFSDGVTSRYSAEYLASRLRGAPVNSLEVDLAPPQLDAVAASAARDGQTVGDFIESAILEKLIRSK